MQGCWTALEGCWCNVMYCISALAAFGNILTIAAIASNPRLRGRSTFIILAFLAAADSSVVTCLSAHCIVVHTGNHVTCVHYNGFLWTNSTGSILSYVFIMLVALERFVVVFFPFLGRMWLTVGRMVVICTLLTVFVMAGNLYIWWLTKSNEDPSSPIPCLYDPTLDRVHLYGYILVTVITWVTLFVLCAAIILRLRRASFNRIILLGNRRDSVAQSYARTNTMLIANILAFLILIGPLLCVEIAIYVFGSKQIPNDVREGLFLLSQTNHWVNFFLYVLTSREFRVEFLHFLRQLLWCIRPLIGMARRGPNPERGSWRDVAGTPSTLLSPIPGLNDTRNGNQTHFTFQPLGTTNAVEKPQIHQAQIVLDEPPPNMEFPSPLRAPLAKPEYSEDLSDLDN